MLQEEEWPGGWEGLALAIVAQAAEDYREAGRSYLLCPWNRDAVKQLRSLARFFLSPWFVTLTGLDGRDFLNRLKKEVLS